jgi:hypothetical protein
MHVTGADRATKSQGADQASRAQEASPKLPGPAGRGHTLTPTSVLALQRSAGNAAVMSLVSRAQRERVDRKNGRRRLPKIGHLPPVAQSLLEGALEKDAIDEAVRQIYDNMFQKTGWRYQSTKTDTLSSAYINGTADVGMCEDYRNAFAAILNIYDGLRTAHPDDAVRHGKLEIVLGDDLTAQRFVTRRGLTLMGTSALKGNVGLEVDGVGGVLYRGRDKINTFVFNGHWTLVVNGKNYDPIFHSIDEANVATRLDGQYANGAERFLGDTSNPISTGEFGSTWIRVVDYRSVLRTIEDIATLYKEGKTKKAKRVFKANIMDRVTFAKVVDVARNQYADPISKAQKDAFHAIDALVR